MAKISAPRAQGDLDGGQSYSAGPGVNQNAFAWADCRQVLERMAGGEKRAEQRHGFFARTAGRLANHQPRIRQHEPVMRTRRHGDHLVAFPDAIHTCTDAHDPPAAFASERSGVTGIEIERIQHIAEHQARYGNRDFDFSGARTPPPRRPHFQIVQHAARGNGEPQGTLGVRFRLRRIQLETESGPAAQSEMLFSRRPPYLVEKQRGALGPRLGIEIDRHAAQLGVFPDDAAGHAPERRLRHRNRILPPRHFLRPASDQPQSWRMAGRVAAESLESDRADRRRWIPAIGSGSPA